jgi:hypothetical protein
MRGQELYNKLNEDFNFKFHGAFDVSKIAEHLSKYSSEWFVNDSRQTKSPVHKETNSIFIYEHAIAWSPGDSYDLKVNDSQSVMIGLLSEIIEKLELVHNGTVGKCLFIKLPAHKNVEKHKDNMDYLGVVRRHHIAIETNPNVLFFVNDESKNMQVGECWEINNSRVHGVENNGETDRVHLLIDIMPNRFIK